MGGIPSAESGPASPGWLAGCLVGCACVHDNARLASLSLSRARGHDGSAGQSPGLRRWAVPPPPHTPMRTSLTAKPTRSVSVGSPKFEKAIDSPRSEGHRTGAPLAGAPSPRWTRRWATYTRPNRSPASFRFASIIKYYPHAVLWVAMNIISNNRGNKPDRPPGSNLRGTSLRRQPRPTFCMYRTYVCMYVVNRRGHLGLTPRELLLLSPVPPSARRPGLGHGIPSTRYIPVTEYYASVRRQWMQLGYLRA